MAQRVVRKHIAFGWYGGKFSHLDWLLPLLPPSQHYCEPFGGSAAVLLNREPSPVETYNDIDSEVVNFFRVLRDQKDELVYAIGMTPFSREEYVLAIKTNGSVAPASDSAQEAEATAEDYDGLPLLRDKRAVFEVDLSADTSLPPTELERARRFFVRARQTRTGLAQTASVGRWANCLGTSRAGMAGAVSRWLGSVEELEWIASRLLRVQIEHDSAFNVIRRYDSPTTLFYCDPPYPHGTRGDSKAYQYELSDSEHTALYEVLSHVQGRVAISGYHGELMDGLYSDWHVHEEGSKKAHSVKTERAEVLWTNY
jgi:DNA adenine methylase